MSTTKGEHPAFPGFNGGVSAGLTIREHFASMAMEAILSMDNHSATEVVARESVLAADLLIEALNKE